jgi:cytochrome c-type biogenesis protein CcmI
VTALIFGTVLALVALAFVLYPLFRESAPSPSVEPVPVREPSATEHAIAALREVEFDRETGKLSESDYAALKTKYMRDALAALRAEESLPAAVSDDEVEAVILAYRVRRPECVACGPRPESDAVYCSHCGRHLSGKCGRCGSVVAEPGARYCTTCGATLAA